MIPKILDRFEKEIGLLPDCIDGIAIEERNGMCEVEIIYPIFSTNWNQILRGNVIVADVNDTLKLQKFRIYKVSKPLGGQIKVYARHIFFDLARDFIESVDLTNASCEYALNTLFRSSQFSQVFTAYSDIIVDNDYKISNTNLIKCIGGTQGSILDSYGTGAEILRDNRKVYLLNKRGHDNGVSIEYAKNMTGLNIEFDDSSLITRIKAIAKYNNEENEEIIVNSSPRYIDSPLIGNYETPFIEEIDFSDKFEDGQIPTAEKLKAMAENYFLENKCDQVKTNIKVEFIPLSKCVGYADIQDKISLCDTVAIKDYRYNLDTQAKVIKTYYNFLTDRYEKMELGDPKTNLGDIVGGGTGNEGKPGKPGPPGPPGMDGNLGDFPDSLPAIPVITNKVFGFASIELSWIYENKTYYTYELYASKTQGFIPNIFDIIHQGQSSSFLFQVKPNEVWYFRCCAVNSYGKRTEFSAEVKVATRKVDDMSNYFEDVAIGRAVIGALTADYMEAGILKGHWIDARNLSVTDGNGKRTLDIDTFGNVTLLPTNFKILVNGKEEVVTTESVLNHTLLQLEKDLTYYVDETKKVIDKEIEDVHLGVNNLEDTMNGAFKDGIIDEAEAKAIKERLLQIEKEKFDLDGEFRTIYHNVDLDPVGKRTLQSVYDSWVIAYTDLRTTINTAIADGKATDAEVISINEKTYTYRTSLGKLSEGLSQAINTIAANKAVNAVTEAKKYVNETKKVLDKEIGDISTGIGNLESEMNGAFRDGIIDEAEAKAINERLVRIESEKLDLDNEYTTIYNNIDLKNPAKSNLKVAYDDLIAKYSSLRTTIISAIADGIATNAEVRDINNKTELYKTALGVVTTRVNEAINNIAINKAANALIDAKEYVNNEIRVVNNTISDIDQKADNINLSVKSNKKLIDGLDKEKITLDQAKAEIDLKSDNILLQVQSSGGGNILVDSGFDLGNNKWSNFEYSWENRNFTISTWTDSNEWILQGTKAMCINVRGYEAAGELGFEQRIGVKKNQEYTLSVLMARHRADGGFHIYDVDSWEWIAWDTILESEPYNAGKDIKGWKRMTVTFNSGNRSTIGIRFKMTKSSNDGHIWITQPMINEGRLRAPWSAKSLEANELVSYINLDSSSVKIKANKIELNGAVTAGDTSGNHIRIEEANYTVMNNGQQRALFGFKNMGNNYDKYVVPKLAMGAFGYEAKHNYFVVIPYRGGDNPQGISNAYVDIGYHCISHDDWSNLKMYDGGDIRIAPIKNFEITTNYDKGSYAGTGERRLALFATINHAYFNSHLQIGAIRNMTNGKGLVLADDTVGGAETRIRVNTDSSRNKYIRPCDNVGDISCGSSGFPWKSVATKTYYATDNLIYNESKNLKNEKIDIIDKIKFISPLDSKSAVLMDISELIGTIYVPVEENVPAIDVTEFLKLALIEIQNLKEKFKKAGL
ncbi:phage tail spike protein [uncultured Clostridium sp.]|uniref:phage tail spike protein n=1 Tax=uncultured Clostridium sp. TaxID=59620 RepID=UPI0026322523|nr:phage tail spike protein [uncultured Clostridium sp.]